MRKLLFALATVATLWTPAPAEAVCRWVWVGWHVDDKGRYGGEVIEVCTPGGGSQNPGMGDESDSSRDERRERRRQKCFDSGGIWDVEKGRCQGGDGGKDPDDPGTVDDCPTVGAATTSGGLMFALEAPDAC